MKNRPASILTTMLYHGITTVYGLIQLPSAFPLRSYSFGQLFILAWSVVALTLLFIKPNAGRWVSFALFAIGGISGCVYLLSTGVSFLAAAPLYAFTSLFLLLGYFLAFGESTKAYIASLKQPAAGI